MKLVITSLLMSSLSKFFRTYSASRMVAGTKKFQLDRAFEENIARKDSYQHIVGCDEAGRGPLAGPVTAAAVYIEPGTYLENIRDSKAITSEADREEAYDLITSHPNVLWSVVSIDNAGIDQMNILQATLKAMQLAVSDVVEKMPNITNDEGILALVDGNKVPKDMHSRISATRAVIKGDSTCFSIAVASILAKVTRDRIMHDLHKKYPQYGFLQNKGYPTVEHRKALSIHGPSHVHRVSYKPVRDAMEKHGMESLPEPFTPVSSSLAVSVDQHEADDSIDTESNSNYQYVSLNRNINGRLKLPKKRLIDDLEDECEESVSKECGKTNGRRRY